MRAILCAICVLGGMAVKVEASAAFPTTTEPAAPAATQPDSPAATEPAAVFATVFLRTLNNEMIKGDVVSSDADTVTIKTFKGPVSHKWIELTTTSACTLRSRLIDKTKAEDWLTFATFAWGMDGLEQARAAVLQTLALDGTLKPKTDALLKSPPGQLLAPLEPKTTSTADSGASTTANEGELFPKVKTPKSSRGSKSRQ